MRTHVAMRCGNYQVTGLLELDRPRKAILVCRGGKMVRTSLSGENSEQMEFL